MPLQQTSGNVTADAYGGGKAVVPNYIEDVFSTYLYTGTAAVQTITNGIDLSTKGGLTWCKARSNAYNNYLFDTARGANNYIISDYTGAQNSFGTYSNLLTSFNSNGFSLGADSLGSININAVTYASWTFRKQPKFFDVVTYTGTGANRTIAHALGSVPGCIIVKRTDTTGDWQVYHNGLTSAAYSIQLNLTNAQASATTVWNSTTPTSSVFSVGTDATVNASGGTYVAYLFAHNAGGFGLTGTDNVISCGSFDGAANTVVTLGYEPQWIMFKNTTSASNWQIVDNMRGMFVGSDDKQLMANLSNAESDNGLMSPTATGFIWNPSAVGNTYIYIAIRRGPMKVPTDATKVFSPQIWTGNGTARTITGTNNPVDLSILTTRDNGGSGGDKLWNDRLRGAQQTLYSNYTQAEVTQSNYVTGLDVQFGEKIGTATAVNGSGVTYVSEMFSRASGFFDVVCYTGNGTSNTAIAHNLGVVPELMIVKSRSGATAWQVYSSALANTEYLVLNTTAAKATDATRWNSTTPTSSVFSLGAATEVNNSGATYVAYLFATAAGVSKVGSYTGTGATQTINCGFTGGARFVLIKRTDSTGDWYVWDTARGMVSGTDPSLLLNSTAAEVNANSIYTTTGGFQIVSTAAGINASGGSYIFLAIA
jgi:hypothetical protein